jgi:hypothetical protein
MTRLKAAWASVLLITGIVSAYHSADEKKFDLFLTTGYGFGVGGQYLASSTTFSGGALTSREDHYENFGWGIKIEGGADYKLMDRLFAQGALCYSIGVPGIKNVTEVVGGSRTTVDYGWSLFGIKALVKPTFQVLDLLDVYTDFGIGLYFASSGATIETIAPGVDNTAKAEDSNNPAFTIIGAIGVDYPINANIIAYGEIYCEQMSFTTTKTQYVNSTYNGAPYNNHTDYYQEDVTDRSAPPKIPGTNIALRVGVRFPLF